MAVGLRIKFSHYSEVYSRSITWCSKPTVRVWVYFRRGITHVHVNLLWMLGPSVCFAHIGAETDDQDSIFIVFVIGYASLRP